MPRRLGEEVNEMRFQDNLSGSEIVLFYRMPTTEERIAYTNESFQRKGAKMINRTTETRMKFGLKILEGFRTGDFEINVRGQWKPLSSNSHSEHYSPDWKNHVQKYASDLIEHLAIRVFDISVQPVDEEAPEDGGQTTGDSEAPDLD
jgi:hypothetical protein